MTVNLNDTVASEPQAEPGSARPLRYRRVSRRKRSLRSSLKRKLDQMLPTVHQFRISLMLSLAAFVYISISNGVLFQNNTDTSGQTPDRRQMPDRGTAASQTAPKESIVERPIPSRNETPTMLTEFDIRAPVPVSHLAIAWSDKEPDATELDIAEMDVAERDGAGLDATELDVVERDVAGLDVVERDAGELGVTELDIAGLDAAELDVVEPDVADAELPATEKDMAVKVETMDNIVDANAMALKNTYVVNEGGSLWRTARRFIDDAVVLDRLIDSLESHGMDVRRIRPGVELIVVNTGSHGKLVQIQVGDATYESRIVDDSITTSVRQQAETSTESSRTAFKSSS